jgi:hypothetical protein
MTKRFPESHKLWIAQCKAAKNIRASFGLKSALDYLVGEKLLGFVGFSQRHPEFAPELPKLIARLRRVFTAAEIAPYLDRLQRAKYRRRRRDPRLEKDGQDISLDDLWAFNQSTRFFRMRELLDSPGDDHKRR